MPPGDLKWIESQKLDLLIESFATAVLTVQLRGFSAASVISASHVTTSDFVLASSTLPISRIPEFLTVQTLDTSVSRGQCYVKVTLRADGHPVALLFAGYVTDAGSQIFPNGKIESSIEGPGLMRVFAGTNPAAGVEISETVPVGVRWRLASMRFALVTDATVITRVVHLTIDDGTTVLLNLVSLSGQAASSTRNQNVAEYGYGPVAGLLENYLPLPAGLMLLAGFRIRTVTDEFVAGDNLSAPTLLIEQWIEP